MRRWREISARRIQGRSVASPELKKRYLNITNTVLPGGKRLFVTLPETVGFERMRSELEALPDCRVLEYLTDGVTEVWIDFEYKGHSFTVNNQLGEYWFFAEDAHCPEVVLLEVAEYCAQKLGKIFRRR